MYRTVQTAGLAAISKAYMAAASSGSAQFSVFAFRFHFSFFGLSGAGTNHGTGLDLGRVRANRLLWDINTRLMTGQSYRSRLITGQSCSRRLMTGQSCSSRLIIGQSYINRRITGQSWNSRLITGQSYRTVRNAGLATILSHTTYQFNGFPQVNSPTNLST